MKRSTRLAAAGLLAATVAAALYAQRPAMTFFVTSTGLGDGGNLGGIKGADAHCQALARNAGAGAKTWRAYLSVTDLNGKGAINARDRIGRGPWHNANGVRIAIDVDDLHSDNANLTADTAVTEKGAKLPTEPARHPHGLDARRPRLELQPARRPKSRGRRDDVQQLHEQCGESVRHGGPPRSSRHRTDLAVERRAPVRRLQPSEARRDRWCR